MAKSLATQPCANQNPHLIYPGDVVFLDMSSGKPQLRLLRETITLQPGAIEEPLDKVAISTIPLNVIAPFLSQPLLIEKDQLNKAPRIIAGQENRVVLSSGTRVYVSKVEEADGINWYAATMPSASQWAALAYGNGVFVAIAATSSIAATSPDGITWTTRTLPSSSVWQGIAFGNGVFVAIAYNGTAAATSTNGIDWTARTLPASAFWYDITYGNNTFVAIAYNGTVAATSPDGITWTSRTLPSSSPWGFIAFGAGKFAVTAGVTASTVAATIDYAVNATSFVLPNVQTITGTTAYIKAT